MTDVTGTPLMACTLELPGLTQRPGERSFATGVLRLSLMTGSTTGPLIGSCPLEITLPLEDLGNEYSDALSPQTTRRRHQE